MTSKDHLSNEQRNALAHQLQSRLDEALQNRSAQAKDASQADSTSETSMQDADDASQRAGTIEVDATLAGLGSVELESLAAALKRVEGSGYGICVDCHAPIPFERLTVEPQAMRCTACQTLQEKPNDLR